MTTILLKNVGIVTDIKVIIEFTISSVNPQMMSTIFNNLDRLIFIASLDSIKT